MSKKNKTEVTLTFLVDKDMAHAARIEAARRNESRGEFIRKALAAALKPEAETTGQKVSATDGR
jgi:plasmid stability protein